MSIRTSSRPYMTLAELGAYLGYREPRANQRKQAARLIQRKGIRKVWRGKAWLVRPEDVDSALAGETR